MSSFLASKTPETYLRQVDFLDHYAVMCERHYRALNSLPHEYEPRHSPRCGSLRKKNFVWQPEVWQPLALVPALKFRSAEVSDRKSSRTGYRLPSKKNSLDLLLLLLLLLLPVLFFSFSGIQPCHLITATKEFNGVRDS